MNKYSYEIYEMTHMALGPMRMLSDATRVFYKNPLNPLSHTIFGRHIVAGAELFERATRRYGKPIFGIETTLVAGRLQEVETYYEWKRPFCRLLHFRKSGMRPHQQPILLIIAPLSGHYATLLRGTVEALLPYFDIYITDWEDARTIPISEGTFDLDDYVDYLLEIFAYLKEKEGGAKIHTMGVCQPAVPLAAATCLLEEDESSYAPHSMILIGGPMDTRQSPTPVNLLAHQRGTDWFRRHCITEVAFPNLGMGRKVYPGFLQLSGFMAMNFDRHVNAHLKMFNHLVVGDGDSALKHREFYDEYLAVMDLPAEYYLQTIDVVFVRHALPLGKMQHRGRPIRLSAIRRCGLMTIEGERDDISGVGQTYAAQELCSNIPAHRKTNHLQEGVGHYGVFNGSSFRKDIVPRIVKFIQQMEREP